MRNTCPRKRIYEQGEPIEIILKRMFTPGTAEKLRAMEDRKGIWKKDLYANNPPSNNGDKNQKNPKYGFGIREITLENT